MAIKNIMKSTVLALSIASSLVAADEASTGFFYASAYNLAPYSDVYINSVFKLSAQTDQPVIVYSNLDRDRYPHDWQINYNANLYDKALEDGADVWMQLRLFDNNARNGQLYTAPQLRRADSVVKPMLHEILDNYASRFDDCKVILFEEAGMYHSPQGGADFWAGGNRNYVGEKLTASETWDRVFAYRFRIAYNYIADIVRSRTHCEVGYHIGHSAVYRSWGGKRVIEQIAKHTETDFIMYDLYPSASPSYESYVGKLSDRIPALSRIAPVYYVNQSHTMNNFAFGGGQTPSAQQMRDSTNLAYNLGAEKVGWYTKNARATVNFSEAFEPNLEAQQTVLESSPLRLHYALGLTSQ